MDHGSGKYLGWGALGLALGVLLAYQQRQTLSEPLNRAMIPSADIEQLLRSSIEGRPQLDQIVIVPTARGYKLLARELQFQNSVLTFSNVYTEMPRVFHPQGRVRPSSKTLPFIDYIRWVTATYPHVHYEYRWWDEPLWLFGSYGLLGAILGAVIWPVAITLLAGGEVVFLRTGDGHAASKRKTTLSSEELPADIDGSGLERVIEPFEDHLKDAVHPVPEDLSKLIDLTKTIPAKIIEDEKRESIDDTLPPTKDFGGEFYPTELHPDGPTGTPNTSIGNKETNF